ncbi:hypothetical protein EOM09_04890 [bacterium]|nr:hypothetical protein [bacterium]
MVRTEKWIEKWTLKGKKIKVFVVRSEKGSLITWRKQAKSGLKKKEAQELYKTNKSFRRDKQVQKLTNYNEITILKDSSLNNRNKKIITPKPYTKTKIVQYVVQGYYNKVKITTRSQTIGQKFAKSSNQAKEEAWNNFLKLLSHQNGKYDEDEGIKMMDKVTNIKEGWVYYE